MKAEILFVLFTVCGFAIAKLPRTNDNQPKTYPGFTKLGSYEIPNSEEIKSYWIATHFKVTWDIALSICSSYGMELMSLDSQVEAENFYNLCAPQRHLFDRFTHIGGLVTVARSKTDWFWVNSGNKVEINLTFPWLEPNNWGGTQMCLALDKQPGSFMYNDIDCYGKFPEKFICQSREVDFESLARSGL